MSHVTDLILVTALYDGGDDVAYPHPNVDALNAWLKENAYCHRPALRLRSALAGGNKAMQCDVFLGAVNYLPIQRFVEAFRAIPWQYPECVQLFLKDEHDDTFTVYLPPQEPNSQGSLDRSVAKAFKEGGDANQA